MKGYTPTETRLLKILADGQPHRREELHAALGDPLAALSNIRPHLSRIRKRLRDKGQDIVCVYVARTISYRWVRLLPAKSRP